MRNKLRHIPSVISSSAAKIDGKIMARAPATRTRHRLSGPAAGPVAGHPPAGGAARRLRAARGRPLPFLVLSCLALLRSAPSLRASAKPPCCPTGGGERGRAACHCPSAPAGQAPCSPGARSPRSPTRGAGSGPRCRVPAPLPQPLCAPGDGPQLCFCCFWHLNNQTLIGSLSERRQIPLCAESGWNRIGSAGDLSLFKPVSPSFLPRGVRLWRSAKRSENSRPANRGRELLQRRSVPSRFPSPGFPGWSGAPRRIILAREIPVVCSHSVGLRARSKMDRLSGIPIAME